MSREWIIPLAVSVISVVAGVLLYRLVFYQPQFASAPPVPVQASSPVNNLQLDDLVLTSLDDQAVKLTEYRQSILVVNFWAPWCAPCRREIPALIETQDRFGEQVKIIGLSFDSKENVLNFKPDYAFNYPLLLVGAQAPDLNQLFGNSSGGLPFTAILNPDRDVVFQHSGEITADELAAAIEEANQP